MSVEPELGDAVLVMEFDPQLRRALVERLEAHGARFASQPPPRGNWISPFARFGEGTIVELPAAFMTNARLGRFVIVRAGTCIGHDVELEDFVSVDAGACVSGYVVVRSGATIGKGAVVINGSADHPLVIGAGAWIAPGAVVTKSVPCSARVAGNPARRVRA